MRKSRCALLLVVVFVALLVYLNPTLGTASPKEFPQWTSSKTHAATPLPTMVLSSDNLKIPLAVFATAVEDAQIRAALTYLAAINQMNAQKQSVGSTSPPSTTTPPPDTSGTLLEEWTRVATCEEGGWIGYAGPSYPDSLGINAQNWYAYGGGSDLSPAAQIAVAQRLLAANGQAGWVPDQGSCASW